MGRTQMESAFDRLYAGADRKALVEQYYQKKRKDMVLLFLGGTLFLLILCIKAFQDAALETGEGIERNAYGKGGKEVTIEARRREGEWTPIRLNVEEKAYEKAEIEEFFTQLEEELQQRILKENSSVEEIRSDLDLPVEVEGYPLQLSWQSSHDELLDSSGRLYPEQLAGEEELVELTVTMQYQEWEREHHFFVRVLAAPLGENELFWKRVSEDIQRQEEETRLQEEILLPDVVQGEALTWRNPVNKGVLLLVFLFPFFWILIGREKDQEIYRKVKAREEQLEYRYPEFVSKLILFMEAGMTAKQAIYRIVQQQNQKRGKGERREYLEEELQYICHRMRNGLGEREAYELLAKRCNLALYRKLSTLLIQNMQKGSYGMLETLRQERWQANEERKNRIRKKGEEAGTKLLFPMVLLLGMVMILIIVPACFSFSV